jgi:hypothetical protein
MNKCAICGEPSGHYCLCKKHGAMIKTGEVVKNYNGDWVLAHEETFKACLVCSQPSHGKPLCHDCWAIAYSGEKNFIHSNYGETEYKSAFDKTVQKLKVSTDPATKKADALQLFSLAFYAGDAFGDQSLIGYSEENIGNLLKSPTELEEEIPSKCQPVNNKRKHPALDGHYLESHGEATIDDILYNLGFLHCVGKRVSEFCEVGETTAFSDFYIPGSRGKGIYIEY